MRVLVSIACGLLLVPVAHAGEPDRRFPLFEYLKTKSTPTLVTYAPSQLDPRQEVNQRRLPTSSIRADLEALRPAFDGLVLYGYHEACTPRVLAVARDLKFRAVILAVWDIKSAAEIDGVCALVRQFEKDFVFGVLVGNEGITFKRYEPEDLTIAAARLRGQLPKAVPISTSEPLVGYKHAFVRDFGDFLMPNIHPVFDRPDLAADKAADWVVAEALNLVEQTKKPVFVKETGFPHGGKAGYTPETQEAFWAAYLKPGRLERPSCKEGTPWAYLGIAFDAFDLPWKAEESKLPIERSWGLFNEKREPLPAFAAWRAAHGDQDAAPVRIVTLGDSITRGVRTGVKAEETFSGLLQKQLGERSIKAEVINRGIGGERTDLALKRLAKDVLALKPAVVVVMYGTNDSYADKGKSDSRLSIDEYRRNLEAMVAEIRKAGARPVLMTSPRWGDKAGVDGAGDHPNVRLEKFVQVCREVAARTKTPLADHYQHWSKRAKDGVDIGGWTTDQCHPNPEGHRQIVDVLLPVIVPALR